MPKDTSTGTAMGIMIVKYILKCPAPSICAASAYVQDKFL